MNEEKEFRLRAHATFYATDIDDAFAKLSEHFKIVAEGGYEREGFFKSGKVSIRKEG